MNHRLGRSWLDSYGEKCDTCVRGVQDFRQSFLTRQKQFQGGSILCGQDRKIYSITIDSDMNIGGNDKCREPHNLSGPVVEKEMAELYLVYSRKTRRRGNLEQETKRPLPPYLSNIWREVVSRSQISTLVAYLWWSDSYQGLR
ncbi:hypothetical protein OIU79_026274 [Salix purpurea]|uniref:Uncharacterized protein n=1 Tax=Salix purpurea TaxID=77065 RepID=A0A9Q0VQY7_SALPP|nr:hypothetical protein OIU79_026274 [Salix purpurea]